VPTHACRHIYLDVIIIAFLTPIIEVANPEGFIEKTKERQLFPRINHAVEMTVFCQKDRRHSSEILANNADYSMKSAGADSGTLFVIIYCSD
jgi:hypothetical protein